MHAKLGGEERVIRAGEALVVPAGQVHAFRNPSEGEPLVIRISVEPALQFQWMMSEYARLAIANGGRRYAVPLLETAYIRQQTRDEHELPGMPRLLTSVFFGSLAALAVLLGKHRKISPKPAPLVTNGMEAGQRALLGASFQPLQPTFASRNVLVVPLDIPRFAKPPLQILQVHLI